MCYKQKNAKCQPSLDYTQRAASLLFVPLLLLWSALLCFSLVTAQLTFIFPIPSLKNLSLVLLALTSLLFFQLEKFV